MKLQTATVDLKKTITVTVYPEETKKIDLPGNAFFIPKLTVSAVAPNPNDFVTISGYGFIGDITKGIHEYKLQSCDVVVNDQAPAITTYFGNSINVANPTNSVVTVAIQSISDSASSVVLGPINLDTNIVINNWSVCIEGVGFAAAPIMRLYGGLNFFGKPILGNTQTEQFLFSGSISLVSFSNITNNNVVCGCVYVVVTPPVQGNSITFAVLQQGSGY